jgi:hypothetical protein
VSSGRPILVTGSIRSGTTWVGQVLGTAPEAAVIHEPFNIDHPIGIFAHRWSHQYTYVTDGMDDAEEIERAMQNTLTFRYRPIAHLRNPENTRRALGLFRDLPQFWYRRHISKPRPIVKDPVALFSAEWLAAHFDMDVVVMVRHPAAFAWSYQRIAEPNRFADLLDQEALIGGDLAPFVGDIERGARSEDPIEQAAILWRIVYATVAGFQNRHPDWSVIRHEGLSADPHRGFSDLSGRLGLSFTQKTRQFIDLTTSELNPVEAPRNRLHHLRRNSRRNVEIWQERLSPPDIRRVRQLTADISDRFYATSTWPRFPKATPSGGSRAPSEATRS